MKHSSRAEGLRPSPALQGPAGWGSVPVLGGVVLRGHHQAAPLPGPTVHRLDDVNHLLLVLHGPVDLVVVAGAQVDHDMLVPAGGHGSAPTRRPAGARLPRRQLLLPAPQTWPGHAETQLPDVSLGQKHPEAARSREKWSASSGKAGPPVSTMSGSAAGQCTAMRGSTGWEHGAWALWEVAPGGGASVTPAGVTLSCFKASWSLMPRQGSEMEETAEASRDREIRLTPNQEAPRAERWRHPHTRRAAPALPARSRFLGTDVPWGNRKVKGHSLRPSEAELFQTVVPGNTKVWGFHGAFVSTECTFHEKP